jgi:LuxR family transcriptional regulator, maltose regulon positive regulatory protein
VSTAPTAVLESVSAASHARPQRLRRGTVRRERLVRKLVQSADIPLVVVRAPAGYGKTTLLCQWDDRDDRPFAWTPPHGAVSLGDAIGALHELEAPAVVVVDDTYLHADAGEAHELTRSVPPGSQVAVATRAETPLPLGSLRAQGQVVEIGMSELAMTRGEAAAMLSMAGVELDPADLAALFRHTEGWPAALYLAALSMRGEADPHGAVTGFAGDDRLVADYLQDEVLTRLPAPAAAFLLRTSVLRRLSGPACDAVLGRSGSGTLLRDLSRSGIPLVPLDHADCEYRHHPLLGEMLRAEQGRRDPRCTSELHRRAGAWLEREGDMDSSLEHAIAAGDLPEAGARLWAIAGDRIAHGHAQEIRDWLGRFRAEQISSQATLALAAATTHVAEGDRDRIEHWVDIAERLIASGQPAPASAPAALAALRAVVGRAGLAVMAEDAAGAYASTAEHEGWRPLACLLRGVGLHLLGDPARAVPLLEEGARRGGVVAPSAQVLCLAQLALITADDEDWEQAALLASRARAQVERTGLDRYPTSAMVYAVSALVRAHRDRVEAAHDDCRQGRDLLETLVDAPPWYAVQARVALARATLRLGDAVGCRALLDEAAHVLQAVADAPLPEAWIESCRAQADAFAIATLTGPASLTAAELRVLRMLPTHLSFREMGARLHVTANTVKTHAHAVYRKLDACSRSEAVGRARSLGLLDG